MSAGTSALFCLVLWFLVCSSEAWIITITAEPGQDVTLPCQAPYIYKEVITAVKWTRPGLYPDHVLMYRGGKFRPDYQHPSYRNRTDLQDRQMTDRNVSLVLSNVTMEDTGIYQCTVVQEGTDSLTSELISTIKLEVGQPGDPDVRSGGEKVGIVLGSVGVILLAVISSVVGFLI